MSKFTPGPWECGRFHETGPVSGIGINAESVDESIARAWLVDDAQECKANARLIAAAPEMYALLQEFVTDITDEDHRANDWSEQVLVRSARALLSKIDGTESYGDRR